MTMSEPEAVAVPEAEPAVAAELFGDRIGLARGFFDALVEQGETLGLIGPRELPQLWSRHLLNSVLVAPLLPGRVADVGSGGGFPGIVLAIARPDVEFTLIEPMERRVQWLQSQADALGLENVRVLRARAEEVELDEPFDAVTARAVSALSKLIPWTAPLVRSGGELLLLKGERVHDEIEKARKVIRKHRLESIEVLELGGEHGLETTRVFRAVVDP